MWRSASTISDLDGARKPGAHREMRHAIAHCSGRLFLSLFPILSEAERQGFGFFEPLEFFSEGVFGVRSPVYRDQNTNDGTCEIGLKSFSAR